MSPNGTFENVFDDYSREVAQNVLNVSEDGLCEKFHQKLQSFKETKLQHLITNMRDDIFYDGTVYTGSAGLALYYVLTSIEKNGSHDILKTALEYINLDNLKGRKISFLCGDAGPLALATVISHKLGSRRPEKLLDHKVLAQRLITLGSLLNDSPDELLYGKSGYLYALLFVNKYVSGKDLIPANHIEKVINSILKSGKQFSTLMKSESPLLWQWHDKVYLGAAHGIAGILYMLLQARVYINIVEIRSFIKPTLDWLLNHRYPSGNFPSSLGSSSGDRLVQWCHGAPGFVPLCLLAHQARVYINIVEIRSFIKPTLDWLLNHRYPSGNFPSSLGSSSGDRLVQWCHGAPGFVPLCLLAHQIFEDDKYLKIAQQCGELIWQRGLSAKGYSLCHGVSGNAYAFLQLYQATKKAVHLYRACCFTEWAALARPGTELRRPDRPASLFEGLLGRVYLAEDITQPMGARFPAMCL